MRTWAAVLAVFLAVVQAIVAVSVPSLVGLASDTAGSGGVHSTAKLVANVTVDEGLAGEGRNGYVGVFTHAAPYFSVQANTSNCSGLATVSTQAKRHSCTYATNAGPFTSLISGGCIGAVISDGHIASGVFTSTKAMFGVTANGTWLLGHVGSAQQASALQVTQLVTGFNWLAYNGVATVTTAGGEVAPRTAVGVDAHGRLVVVVVDGCEKCSKGKGFTMKQIAEYMVSDAVGAVAAINLDGGGSSTFVSHGKVIDYPTCIDVPLKCERAVANILCIA